MLCIFFNDTKQTTQEFVIIATIMYYYFLNSKKQKSTTNESKIRKMHFKKQQIWKFTKQTKNHTF